ncbi:Exopolyphosphatase-related protein [Cardinium endosymbiont of Sogatella furcifera]|uniref:DHH family phosphoesterase n=1 Tax=Cardinium endosymbiont of Sogatella furcifera TaxID=650378 RepID=UPI000E0D8757|nr:DHH family phosphoesterase [Cardinium endosymbiont of Sogatella furcifera]AXI24046.1 Exopolyphosphatase-related protein [Cardinium endosymbiont of Sogatella furcifera]
MYDISILKEQLASPKQIAVVMHARPDGDALGTSLALALFLREQGHSVHVIAPTAYPTFLSWLPGVDTVIVAAHYTQEALLAQIKTIDLLFCVDFSAASRLDEWAYILKQSDAFKVIIDHHIEPENFANLLLWDPKAAASAEVLFQIFEALGQKEKVTLPVATCLYTGIVTDTNSFKNPNTRSITHRIAADLIAYGVDPFKVQRLIYDNKSLNRLHFFSFAVSQRLVVLPALHVAYFVIQKDDYKRYDLKSGDTEGLVDYALSLKGISLAAVLKEKDEMVYLSLRSVGDIPANLIAKKYFSGGGHKNAAGGVSHLSLTETVDQFEKILQDLHLNF